MFGRRGSAKNRSQSGSSGSSWRSDQGSSQAAPAPGAENGSDPDAPRRPQTSGWGGRGGSSRSGVNDEPLPPAKLRLKAIAMLARREHSRAELRGKLRRFSSDAAAIDEVLEALQAGDYLSDERTAASISRVRGARYGSLRVANDLRSKGIGGELATATLAALKSTEAERAQALWEQKFGAPPTDANERARQMRFLQARGFASDLIRKTVPPLQRAG